MTLYNRAFSLTDTAFRRACMETKTFPTVRQASKWRKGKGAAYKQAILHIQVHNGNKMQT